MKKINNHYQFLGNLLNLSVATSQQPAEGSMVKNFTTELTLSDVKTMLTGTSWVCRTDEEKMTDTLQFLSATDGRYSNGSAAARHMAYEVIDFDLNGASGELYVGILRLCGDTDDAIICCFPQVTATSLGSILYLNPLQDANGYFKAGTGQCYKKTES